MELSTFVLLFLSIAGPVVICRPAESGKQQQELHSDSNRAIVDYLASTVKDAQYYRREISRQLDVLTHLSEGMREHPTSSERQLLIAGLIDRLAWTYNQLDQNLDVIVPENLNLSNELLNEAASAASPAAASSSSSSDSNSDDESNLSKRAWPKRMYTNKYSNIPVIRTGK